MQAVPWTMTMPGSCWSVCAWQHSVQTQSRDVVVEDLYAKYPDVDALAEADVEDIERIVSPAAWDTARPGT